MFKDPSQECQDVFSSDSLDIGKTRLIMMDIDTENSPSISRKPYTLPLKHATRMKHELEIFEEASVITISVLTWASFIIVVPTQHTVPVEPPKQRLCVDYIELSVS